MKKALSLFLAVLMLLGILGCTETPTPSTPAGTQPSGNNPTTPSNNQTDPTNNQTDPTETVIDFGGNVLKMGYWYAAGDPVDENSSEWAKFVAEYHQEVMTKYNFSREHVNVALTGDYTSLVPAKIMAGDTDVNMYYFFEGYVLPCVSQGLLWDLTQLDSFDKDDPKWNKLFMDAFTFGDAIYCVDNRLVNPLMGVFYNKRILREAGLDEDLPYKLQAEGKWTWSALEEILEVVVQDTNNDGVIDIQGWAGTYGNMALSAVWSNGAAFVTRDETGKYVDGSTTPEFLEALEWLQHMAQEGYLFKKPRGGSGSYAIEYFQRGELAFMPHNFWAREESYMVNCVDDWGWVYLPMGNSVDHYCMAAQAYGAGISTNYTKEEAELIFQMFDVYTDIVSNGSGNDWTIEGADEFEDIFWSETYYDGVRDTNSVDETLAMMLFDESTWITDYVRMIPNYNYTSITSDIVNAKMTAAEKIESFMPENRACIDQINKQLGYN